MFVYCLHLKANIMPLFSLHVMYTSATKMYEFTKFIACTATKITLQMIEFILLHESFFVFIIVLKNSILKQYFKLVFMLWINIKEKKKKKKFKIIPGFCFLFS